MQRQTIASFDGTPIGVQTFGPEDAPVLLMANGLGATVEAYRFIMERFPRSFRYVCWDYRGLHSSARPVRGYASLSVADHAKDARAVLDALGIQEFHALAWSMGVQVILELVRLCAERFETLVLHNGVPGKTFQTLGAPAILRRALEPVLVASQRVDGFVEGALARVVDSRLFVDVAIRVGLVHHDVKRETFVSIAKGFKDIDMHLCMELLRQLDKHDASDVLPRVPCPALIVQGTADQLTPLRVAQRMAREIPGARLVLLAGGTHYAAMEMPDVMNDHLEEFWRMAGVDV